MSSDQVRVTTVRMPAEQFEALQIFAQTTGRSMNDVICAAVRDYLTNKGRREEFDTILEESRTQYRVALDKLAGM